MNPSVAILLSTYNGEKYISEQLYSILRQKYDNFKVYVRDDGSIDDTMSIIESYQQDKRVTLISDTLGNVGVVGSFMTLLSKVNADIYMFSDQDDVWCDNKINDMVGIIRSSGLFEPLLVHSDLRLVSERLELISMSFMANEGLILPRAHNRKQMLIQNCVVGCSLAITNKLKQICTEKSDSHSHMAMHDWWIALVASYFGKIIYTPYSYVDYRQHKMNQSGSKARGFIGRLIRLKRAIVANRFEDYIRRVSKQAEYFKHSFEHRLSQEDAEYIENVVNLGATSSVIDAIGFIRGDYSFQNNYMNVRLLMLVIKRKFFLKMKL